MPNQEEMEKEAHKLGERIALLLVASSFSDEEKTGYLSLLPEMSLEQIDRLILILEANIKQTEQEQTDKFKEGVESIQADYEKKRQAAEDEAMAGLDEIEAILNQSEK
jgi:adenylate kinase